MARKLATIRRVEQIVPIQGKDKIVLAIFGGWQVIVQKEEIKAGDLVLFCEIDSFLPVCSEYQFLASRCYRQNGNGAYGYRLKTMKMGGVISQGLALPVPLEYRHLGEGTDLTEKLGITLYEKKEEHKANSLRGQQKKTIWNRIKNYFVVKFNLFDWNGRRRYPTELSTKSDENRVQNFAIGLLAYYEEKDFWITEKVDGSSITIIIKNNKFSVCSRNFELKEKADCQYWNIVNKYNLREKLRDQTIVLHGELLGASIQSNKYNVKENEMFIYNIETEKNKYLTHTEMVSICNYLGLKTVPLIAVTSLAEIGLSYDTILKSAEGKSVLNPLQEREGLVFKYVDEKGARFSFKAISNKFLLEEKE